ncbi:MAG: Rrf2 family transcriptional regulator [Gammaproteobacteria bacterium]|nr:Rrf2 family transcriptional regulator [Gammaproteobacteria bacterium]MCP5425266.1 Rrf2 family transcriptional regulator [Gammaproteobacteria bacterium]
MRLTQYTDYALRVLIYVGLKTELATIAEIAQAYGISRNHLVKIVHNLGSLGYLQTLRGKYGGLRLAKPAREINIGTVVRTLEEDLCLVECFDPHATGRCCIEPACVLRHALEGALEAFFQELDRYSLADLLVLDRNLAKLLALPPPARSRVSPDPES